MLQEAVAELKTIKLEWKAATTPNELPAVPGLYVVVGGMYGNRSARLLIYVGKSERPLAQRWLGDNRHLDWLERSKACFDARLFYAEVHDADLIDDLETVLIYVHQPNENSQKLSRSKLNRHFVIENTGEVLPLEAHIDTRLPWFGMKRTFTAFDCAASQ